MSQFKSYASATSFRQALEARLLAISRDEAVDVQRLRRQVSFDRLLCRLFKNIPAPWVLKGGYAMELRLALARATRDIDLSMKQPIAGDKKDQNIHILELLQKAASIDLQDFFIFRIGEPVMDLDAAPYGGGRFPVETRMDGRRFTEFHLDVGLGDVVIEPVPIIRGRDWLGYAGILPAECAVISEEQQFAEKYHAYTLIREMRQNSRVRDLVDMILLIQKGTLETPRIVESLMKTFERRNTHQLPLAVPTPPESWEKPFAALADSIGLQSDLGYAYTELTSFIASVFE